MPDRELVRLQDHSICPRLRLIPIHRPLGRRPAYNTVNLVGPRNVARTYLLYSSSQIEAETTHRQHAIVEPSIADLKASALAHLPSGNFQANNAWLTLAAIAHNLTRAAGVGASPFHATAETATIRDQLIHVPARIARSGRRLVIHLPDAWPWEHAWQALFTTAHAPPATVLT